EAVRSLRRGAPRRWGRLGCSAPGRTHSRLAGKLPSRDFDGSRTNGERRRGWGAQDQAAPPVRWCPADTYLGQIPTLVDQGETGLPGMRLRCEQRDAIADLGRPFWF